ncbi:MAG: septum site-determining protein MinD [Candidatus Caenarcaniphilales bacterium]|nr:septum site-determining protein MinD [Candidatus Caenarcaniphilales bacterium]
MPGKTILFTSGKGGVGKTTSTANIAVALAAHDPNLNICMIDMDIGLRNLDIQLGLENRIVYNLVDVVEGTCKVKQALVRDKRLPNLSLLPAAQTRDKTAVTPDQMVQLVSELREMFDLVLIDCPAGIEQGFHNSAAAADEAIIISTPEMSAVRDADRVIGLLESYPRKISCWLIINRLRPSMVKTNDMMSVDDVLEILGIRLLGVVPEDEKIIVATNKGEPIALSSKNGGAGQAYRNIAMRLTGVEVPLLDVFNEKQNIFVRQLNKLKSLIKFG